MSKIFKYDKVNWLVQNPDVLELIPEGYNPDKTIFNDTKLMRAYELLHVQGFLSDRRSRLNPTFQIAKLASEARVHLKKKSRMPMGGRAGEKSQKISFGTRADAICQIIL